AVIRHPESRGCGCADTPWILEVGIDIDSTVDDAIGVDQWFLVSDEIGLDKTGGEGNAGRADKCAEQRGGRRTSAEVLPRASRFGSTGCERRERACVAPEGRRGDHEGTPCNFYKRVRRRRSWTRRAPSLGSAANASDKKSARV